MPLSTATTDAMGKATVMIDSTKAAYVEVSGAAVVTSLFHFNHLGETPVINPVYGVLTPALLDSFVGLVGATVDPERGHLGMTTLDCLYQAAPGVQVAIDTADAMSTFGYFVGAVPNKTATETDATGLVGIANLPVGVATASSKVASDGKAIGDAIVNIRKGCVSGVTVTPE